MSKSGYHRCHKTSMMKYAKYGRMEREEHPNLKSILNKPNYYTIHKEKMDKIKREREKNND